MKKKLIITLSIIVGIVLFGYLAYTITYNILAPKVFDYIVEKNPEALLDLSEEKLEEALENPENLLPEVKPQEEPKVEAPKPQPKPQPTPTPKPQPKPEPTVEKIPEEKPVEAPVEKSEEIPPVQPEEPKENPDNVTDNTGGYSTDTSIGVLTTMDLMHVLKTVNQADKVRIISICKSCIAPKDLPKFVKAVTGGLEAEEMAYIENYLRATMTIPQKKEILDILKNYLD